MPRKVISGPEPCNPLTGDSHLCLRFIKKKKGGGRGRNRLSQLEGVACECLGWEELMDGSRGPNSVLLDFPAVPNLDS